jgi:hypothetical protein
MDEMSLRGSRSGPSAGSSGYNESLSRVGLVEVTRSVLVIIGFAVSVSLHISFAMSGPSI